MSVGGGCFVRGPFGTKQKMNDEQKRARAQQLENIKKMAEAMGDVARMLGPEGGEKGDALWQQIRVGCATQRLRAGLNIPEGHVADGALLADPKKFDPQELTVVANLRFMREEIEKINYELTHAEELLQVPPPLVFADAKTPEKPKEEKAEKKKPKDVFDVLVDKYEAGEMRARRGKETQPETKARSESHLS